MAYYSNESKILAKPFAFSEDFLPPTIQAREAEASKLRGLLKPTVDGEKPPHIWVHGPSGSGKTSLVESVLTDLDRNKGPRWLRINCWEDPTNYLVLDRLCRELRLLRAEQQSTSIKLQRLKQHWGSYPFVLVLDEIDMMAPKERATLLYTLSNVGKVGLVAIAYNIRSLAYLDRRVRSRLSPSVIRLKPYSDGEVTGILKTRAEFGLQPESWKEGTLRKIARVSENDARLAIQILRNAAHRAERIGAAGIAEEHLETVPADLAELKIHRKVRDLTQHHRILHDTVVQAQEITSSDLWRSYQEQCKHRNLKSIAPRTYLGYLNRLVRLRLIEEEFIIDRGRQRLFRPVNNGSGRDQDSGT